MLLRRISLRNIGLYQGHQNIDLSVDRKRPVTLVGGRNGAGKTTLLNAIPLALYGNRAKSILGASSYPEYLNGLIHHGETHAFVGLEFDRREGGRTSSYVIKREWSRTSSGKSSDTLFVTVDDKPRPEIEANWTEFVERIMPLSISGLAIFDGEKIESLADVDSSAEVLRTSLHGLLGLDLVDRLHRDLAEYRRKVAHSSTSAEDAALVAKLTEAEDQLTVTVADVEAAEEVVAEATRRHQRAELALIAANDRLVEGGGDLFARREALHEDLHQTRATITAANRNLESLVAGDLPLLMVRSLLEQVIGVGERQQVTEEAAMLLERMKERDERLLERIAGSPETFSSEIADSLDAMLHEDRRSYEVDNHVAFEVTPTATLDARNLLGGHGDDLRNELGAVADVITVATDAAASARKSLDSVPTGEAIEQIVRSVADSEASVDAAAEQLKVSECKLAEAVRRAATAQREVDALATKVLETGAGQSDALRVAREIDRAESTLKRFSGRVVERNIESITANISSSLKSLLRKEGLVKRIAIDARTLHLELYGRRGVLIDSQQLSAGERQMLATAVLWGLSKSTGRSLPTVIDTPVGRLDRSHRTNLVTGYFPAASRQIVLLSTDEELVGDYHDHLAPHIGASYVLDYDEVEDLTIISEGYFE